MNQECFTILPSKRKYKKFMVKLPNGKTIHFGDDRYEDFTIHRDKQRKNAYILRHAPREDWSNLETAGTWSRWLLWNKPTLQQSIKDMERRFGIRILLCASN